MSWPPRFIFIAARLSLDFAQTGGEGERARWERWHSPDDLADWFEMCPFLRVRPNVTPQNLLECRALREAILNAAQATLRGENVPLESRLMMNQLARHPNLVPLLEAQAVSWEANSNGQQAISTVARDAIELFGSDAKAKLRKCQNPNCNLLFVDTSRPGKRLWCSMERCGNLSKIARYRATQRPTDTKATRVAAKGR
jgi:predicted RNA-binding Zn ribbon-like protein